MKTTLKTLIIISALATWVVIFLTAVGCQDEKGGKPIRVRDDSCKNAAANDPYVAYGGCIADYFDYGNGVLYFPGDGAKFGKRFSAWRAEHPKWIIIAIAGDNDGLYGANSGYYVIANPDL